MTRSAPAPQPDGTPRRRRRRVLIVNHYADAPDRPTGTRHYTLARAVVRNGGSATILASGTAAGDDRSADRVPAGSISASRVYDGVRFRWLRTIGYHGNSWRRMANMASFGVMVVLADLAGPRPDVVVGSTVHPFAALAGWVVATRRRVPFIYEIRDLWPQTLIDLGAMREGSPGARLLGAIESFLVRRAATVITLLPGVSMYLDLKGLPSDHVRYLPNGADFTLTDGATPDRATCPPSTARTIAEVDRLRAEGVVVFAYVGSHGRVNRLDVVVRAMAAMQGRCSVPVHLLMVGDGPERDGLIALRDELGLTNVTFADPVPKGWVPELLRHIDAGVVHATRTPVYRYGISFNKVFDYMAARRPIAFGCVTAGDPIVESGGGVSVEPDDPELFADALIQLAEMGADARAAMGERGRSFVETRHDMARIGDEFAAIVGVMEPIAGDGR